MTCPDCEDLRQDLAGCEADAEGLSADVDRWHKLSVRLTGELQEARARIEDLERWKAEALDVLTRWDAVAEQVDVPLGALKPLAVGDRIADLTADRAALKAVVEHPIITAAVRLNGHLLPQDLDHEICERYGRIMMEGQG